MGLKLKTPRSRGKRSTDELHVKLLHQTRQTHS
jgi:hypothetical protein